MLFKAADELLTFQYHPLLFIAIPLIFTGKGYRIVLLINSDDPVVADGYFMGISA